MKTRRETRKGGQSSPHFVLRNKAAHLNYSKVEGALGLKDLSKHF